MRTKLRPAAAISAKSCSVCGMKDKHLTREVWASQTYDKRLIMFLKLVDSPIRRISTHVFTHRPFIDGRNAGIGVGFIKSRRTIMECIYVSVVLSHGEY